jgi:hypothetical protein
MLDVREAELGAPAAGDLDHRRGEVGRDHAAALADERGDLEACVSRAGRELENRVPRPRPEYPDQPFAHGCRGRLDLGRQRSHPGAIASQVSKVARLTSSRTIVRS